MFALESCEGFVPMWHMWCCTKRQCNIQYTEQTIEDLGYPIREALEILTCHQLTPSGTCEHNVYHNSFASYSKFDIKIPLLAVAAVTLIVAKVSQLYGVCVQVTVVCAQQENKEELLHPAPLDIQAVPVTEFCISRVRRPD